MIQIELEEWLVRMGTVTVQINPIQPDGSSSELTLMVDDFGFKTKASVYITPDILNDKKALTLLFKRLQEKLKEQIGKR